MDRKDRQEPAPYALAVRIVAERRAIQERLAAMDQQSPARERGALGGDNTPTSEVMEVVQESVAKDLELASREVLVARLRALVRAEEKIRDGTYGRCEICGQPIPSARLKAVPEAVRCVPCAEQSS
jgi:DnaK suppressor protein